MLVLTRKLEEAVQVGDDITVKVLEIRGDQVRLGIAAPRRIPVLRQEIYDEIRRANLEAATPAQPPPKEKRPSGR